MLRAIERSEDIKKMKNELVSIHERIESGKYGPGFCEYLRGKEQMILDCLRDDYGVKNIA